MALFYSFLTVYFSLSFLWFYYVGSASLLDIRQRHDVKWYVKIFAIPPLLLGAILDIILNILLASIIFVDLPREWLFTDRLIRYRNDPSYTLTWRDDFASFICEHYLNPFDDSGDHC